MKNLSGVEGFSSLWHVPHMEHAHHTLHGFCTDSAFPSKCSRGFGADIHSFVHPSVHGCLLNVCYVQGSV